MPAGRSDGAPIARNRLSAQEGKRAMTKSDRRARRTVMLLPDETVRTPATAAPDADFVQVQGNGVSLQETMLRPDGAPVLVDVRAGDGTSVYGWVWVDPDTVDGGDGLGLVSLTCERCPEGDDDCAHVTEGSETLQSTLNDVPRGPEWAVAHENVEGLVAESVLEAARARARQALVPTEAAPRVVAARHMADAVQQARERFAARQRRPIPYMTSNATGGLGDQSGGRAFGIELEFVFPRRTDQGAAIRRIGRDLHDAGLTATPNQTYYHAAAQGGYRSGFWSFERDATVAGEIVSPIMYDTDETWEQLSEVCRIVREHDGRPGRGAGCHVTVGCADYDHLLENHENLVNAVRSYEDLLHRVGQNTWRRHHRRSTWSQPQPELPPGGFTGLPQVRTSQSRYYTVNLGHMTGRARTDRAEFRVWDSTVRPEEIQAQINLSLGLAEAACHERDWGPPTPVGTNYLAVNDPGRLPASLAAHYADYGLDQQVQDLGARLFAHPEQREQLAGLYAMTTWERPERRTRRVPYSQH